MLQPKCSMYWVPAPQYNKNAEIAAIVSHGANKPARCLLSVKEYQFLTPCQVQAAVMGLFESAALQLLVQIQVTYVELSDAGGRVEFSNCLCHHPCPLLILKPPPRAHIRGWLVHVHSKCLYSAFSDYELNLAAIRTSKVQAENAIWILKVNLDPHIHFGFCFFGTKLCSAVSSCNRCPKKLWSAEVTAYIFFLMLSFFLCPTGIPVGGGRGT